MKNYFIPLSSYLEDYMPDYMEERNFWNDSRVRAGMINHGKIVEEGGQKFLVVECDEEEGDIKLLCKWDVCPVCDGNGTHVNPNIDCGGLTAEDFDEDPGFAEDYFGGMYDQTCNRCNGLRVVPEVDYDRNDKEMLERYGDHMRAEYDHAAEVAAERAMGA